MRWACVWRHGWLVRCRYTVRILMCVQTILIKIVFLPSPSDNRWKWPGPLVCRPSPIHANARQKLQTSTLDSALLNRIWTDNRSAARINNQRSEAHHFTSTYPTFPHSAYSTENLTGDWRCSCHTGRIFRNAIRSTHLEDLFQREEGPPQLTTLRIKKFLCNKNKNANVTIISLWIVS
jgi:hypothetical protein